MNITRYLFEFNNYFEEKIQLKKIEEFFEDDVVFLFQLGNLKIKGEISVLSLLDSLIPPSLLFTTKNLTDFHTSFIERKIADKILIEVTSWLNKGQSDSEKFLKSANFYRDTLKLINKTLYDEFSYKELEFLVLHYIKK